MLSFIVPRAGVESTWLRPLDRPVCRQAGPPTPIRTHGPQACLSLMERRNRFPEVDLRNFSLFLAEGLSFTISK